MQVLTTQELKSKIANKESFVVDFGTSWCGPCGILKKNIQVAEQKGLTHPIFYFDVDGDKEFAVNEVGIRSVPTVIYFKNGEMTDRKNGVQSPDQLLESVKSLSLV